MLYILFDFPQLLIAIVVAEAKKNEKCIVGCDAGVSFKSAIIREKDVIYTVISNKDTGAWLIIKEIVGLKFDE